MTAAAGRLHGRVAELSAVHELLADREPRPRALLLSGEPGIGKTSVWWEGVRAASAAGLRVLRVRAAPADGLLAFTGLVDLLDTVPATVTDTLPVPQRRALAGLMLRDEPVAAAEPRTIGTALTSVLRALADEAPVVVAIDDVQWLDAPSAAALAFALRRVDGRAVRVLLTQRAAGRTEPAPLDLDVALGVHCGHLRVGPLEPEHLRRIVTGTAEPGLPRSLLARVVAAADGHPLFALEFLREVRGLDRVPEPDEPLPMPARLRELVRGRLDDLAEDDRRLLRLVAHAARPAVGLVARQAGGQAALARWAAAGIVFADRGVLHFAHPLLAAAVRDDATAQQRAQAHAALADAVTGADERARHLALATSEPDPTVASALEKAAADTAARGSPGAGAELAALALSRTPEDDVGDVVRRRLALAALRFRVGDTAAAAGLARQVRAGPALPDQHARALLLLAEIEHESGSSRDAVELCEEGLELVPHDRPLQARLHAQLSLVAADDMVRAAAHADQALAILAALDDPDPATESVALQAKVAAHLALGHGFLREAAERAVLLESKAPAPRVADRASAAMGAWLSWADDVHGAREALQGTLETARDEGDESSIPYALSHLPLVELRLGHLHAARATAEQVLQAARETGQEFQRGQALYLLALIDAHLGDLDAAERQARESLAVARATGDDPWSVRPGLTALGFVELSRGRPDASLEHLRAAVALERQLGVGAPVLRRGTLLLAEALVEVGDLEPARHLIDELAARAAALDTPPTMAVCARLRAQLAAAAGRVEDAVPLLEEALSQHERLAFPFDVARTWFVTGQVERRLRRRARSAAAFTRARAGFSAIGARGWEARAAAEGGTGAPSEPPVGGLTAGEQRVAEVLAAGVTVAQAANALHMSPKTVEVHITRIYRKLRIGSRAELGARLAARSPDLSRREEAQN